MDILIITSLVENTHTLAYRHPKFNLLVKRLQKDQAYRLSYTVNVDNCFGDNKRTWIRDVFDVPVIKISGTIIDYIPDRSNKEEKEDPYAEVILEQRPLIFLVTNIIMLFF